MSISVSMRVRRQVVTEACAWFVEFRTGDATAGTRDRFDEWLRKSPEHIQAYLEVAAAWSELPTNDPQGRIDVEGLVQRARMSRDEDVVVSLPVHRNTGEAAERLQGHERAATLFGRPALAAGIGLLLILAGALGWLGLRDRQTYSTGIGEQHTIRLPDDSIVDLNARSSIRVRYSKTLRAIELVQGQALFHVAKDSRRPFVVRSDATVVRAVGTEFDVYRKGNGLVVTVVEGRVAVMPADAEPRMDPATGHSALLSAGEQMTVTPKAAGSPHHADVEAATAWVQRRLMFEETPLRDVAQEFNRYNVRRLVIDDPELAGQRISGTYSSSDPAALIGFLRAQPGLEVIETAREIRVSRHDAAGQADDPADGPADRP